MHNTRSYMDNSREYTCEVTYRLSVSILALYPCRRCRRRTMVEQSSASHLCIIRGTCRTIWYTCKSIAPIGTLPTHGTSKQLVIARKMESRIPEKAACLSLLVQRAAADHSVGIFPAVDLQIQLGMPYSS
jgi:hypothetical protein